MSFRILIVDDDPSFLNEFGEYLGNFYGVTKASDGNKALSILEKPNDIDIVILDIRMPGRPGTELIREMKKLSPALSVIILTAFSSKAMAIEALRAKADDYLEKPSDIEKIHSCINRLMQEKRGYNSLMSFGIRGKIDRIKAFLLRNSHKKVSLKDAASLVCLSPKYLSRIFKEHVGRTFNEYKLELKVEKAQALLEESDLSIDQISEKLGYQNTESFIRTFKKAMKVTPAKYRKDAAQFKSPPDLNGKISQKIKKSLSEKKKLAYRCG